MITVMIVIFVLGYLAIAMEHKTGINKATMALLMCGILWTIISIHAGGKGIPEELMSQLGDTSEILVYLIGAMTIVDLIEKYGGFSFVTTHIKADNKRKLMWTLTFITFFMSSVLDNMTTTIIMVVFLSKLISDIKERWLFAGIIVIAANSGGAWSPIGDVTTIMLWMGGNVTSGDLMVNLLIPSLASAIIPTWMATRYLKKGDKDSPVVSNSMEKPVIAVQKPNVSKLIFFCGVGALLFVPVFKAITGLPPFIGMIIALAILWLISEIVERKENIDPKLGATVTHVIRNIDMPTIMFFLGILMAVGALQYAGVLGDLATSLDNSIHQPVIISSIIGVVSSVVDNVPLVAACIKMYPIADIATLDPYLHNFIADGLFWHLLTFCAGVGGSLLIIGSAAGVVAMGLEKIPFIWYMKRISLMAFIGYVAGIVLIYLESLFFVF